jgi:hypothetical protein
MKRASYRDGIAWIALNDEPSELDLELIAAYISSSLLADLFQIDTMRVARDVLKFRLKIKQ